MPSVNLLTACTTGKDLIYEGIETQPPAGGEVIDCPTGKDLIYEGIETILIRLRNLLRIVPRPEKT